MKTTYIDISGMTCASCTGRVERKVGKMNGVSSVAANLVMNNASVTYDESLVSLEDIIATIEQSGYQVTGHKDEGGAEMCELNVRLGGMTCAACSGRIEKKVGKLAGVDEVSVNLALESGHIVYDPAKVSYADIKDTVEKAGYTIEVLEQSSDAESAEGDYKRRFILSAVLSAFVFFLSMPHMVGMASPLPDHLLNPVLFVLTTGVLVFAGAPFYTITIKNLRHFSADMNTLVALGTFAAYAYSSAITFFPHFFAGLGITHVYFEAAALIITFILMGKMLETRAKSKASGAINALLNLAPKMAIVVVDGQEMEVPASSIKIGDIVRVKPGGGIPVDGKVSSGKGAVDESMLTGESRPVEKSEGDVLFAGTILKSGSLTFTATRVGQQTTLAGIIKLVEQATSSKAPVQKLADRVAAIFVPTVISISIVTFIFWMIFGPEPVLTHSILAFVAVLIISCPCAMGLATPTAIMVSTGLGASRGILIKNGVTLENAGKISTAIFDKTGTLTIGRPVVTDIILTGAAGRQTALAAAAALEKRSEHPIALAILEKAADEQVSVEEPAEFENFEGEGVAGVVNGKTVIIGKRALMERLAIPFAQQDSTHAEGGASVVFLAIDEKPAAVLIIKDELRADAAHTISALKRLGITPVLLSGDNKATTAAIAARLGIEDFYGEMMPADKLATIKRYQEQGETVAMIGDGINDAAALAAADVGISVSGGTDVAIQASDITLIGEETARIYQAIILSRKTLAIIKQNLFWAFIYNIIGIPLAAGVFYPLFGLQLNPVFAGAAMAFSSVSVVTNSLRLRLTNLNK